MNREYATGTDNTAKMFIGTEVENTHAVGMKTLFVVGLINPEEIARIAKFERINHIYLGANHSFEITLPNGKDIENQTWEHLVSSLLDQDFWVTLDYDVKYHEWMLESSFNEHDRFISMISVKLPYIDQLNYNACVKIDDSDFRKSNPGVWVHRVQDLQSYRSYTDWSKYTNDEVIA